MFKNKTLKTILIIFAVITVVGLLCGLLGDLRSPSGSSSGGSSSGGSGNSTIHTHEYSENHVCKTCAYMEGGEVLVKNQKLDFESDVQDLGIFGGIGNECYFMVIFDQGKENETSFGLYYDGGENYHSLTFSNEMTLEIGDYETESISIVSGSADQYSNYETVSLYILHDDYIFPEREITLVFENYAQWLEQERNEGEAFTFAYSGFGEPLGDIAQYLTESELIISAANFAYAGDASYILNTYDDSALDHLDTAYVEGYDMQMYRVLSDCTIMIYIEYGEG